jgi:hypothetical protein
MKYFFCMLLIMSTTFYVHASFDAQQVKSGSVQRGAPAVFKARSARCMNATPFTFKLKKQELLMR